MNTLIINQNTIELCGFDKIDQIIYFIIRNSGVTISSKKEEILATQYKCFIENRKVQNETLALILKEKGFDSFHNFSESDGAYYCINPF